MSSDSSNSFHPIISTSSVSDMIDVTSSPRLQSVDSPTSALSAASFYTADQLKRLLESQKHKYCILKNLLPKELARFWRSFGFPAVLNENGQWEKISGFISCIRCYNTQIYGSSCGTKRFNEHAKKCFPIIPPEAGTNDKNNLTTTTKQTKLNHLEFTRKAKLSTDEQNNLKDMYVKWICTDLRPLSIVEDEGFKNLAQLFIKIGADHGLIDVDDVLRSRQTVTRSITDLALAHRVHLQKYLSEPLEACKICLPK